MVGDSDSCKVVPEVNLGGGVERNEYCGKGLVLDAYQDLLGKSVKIKTERGSQSDAGSGFFVRNGDEIVTAGHVVKNSTSVKVEMPTGELLDARITNYDDINDLALLKVEGLAPDPSRAIELDRSNRDLTGETIFTLGTPGLKNEEKVMSVGNVLGVTKFENILKMGSTSSFAGLQGAFDTGIKELQLDATDYVLGKRLASTQGILPGQSGSMQVDRNGRLVGVVTDSAGDSHSLATPVDKVAQLLNMDGKFNFLYSKKSDFDINPVKTLGVDAMIGGSMLPYVNRVAPAVYGVKRLIDLPSDLSNYSSASAGDFKSQHGRLAAEDVGFGAGGLALSIGFLAKIPQVRYAGMAAFGLAAASSVVGSFEDKHLKYEGYQRKDGTNRQPFMWNFNIAGKAIG
ncbi:trypsin-like peptidase domain-containing protein [bacterium]|nr:trypsin-like peptidase domain-containing protein [bacterium]MBP9094851.1 trypsin-like peptidase domain-containing protein [bacterium]